MVVIRNNLPGKQRGCLPFRTRERSKEKKMERIKGKRSKESTMRGGQKNKKKIVGSLPGDTILRRRGKKTQEEKKLKN